MFFSLFLEKYIREILAVGLSLKDIKLKFTSESFCAETFIFSGSIGIILYLKVRRKIEFPSDLLIF